MSCNDKKKFKTAEASSKASLRTKGAIDKFLNILDVNIFNKLNKKWTIDAVERFGIEGKLFYNENDKAVANKSAFKKIDTAKGINYQNTQSISNEGIIASEKTIRDLSAKIADRIGMKVVFESDRSKDYKGKIENNVAYVNLAYATLDTPIHEILGHPIIRAIKNRRTDEGGYVEQYNNAMQEFYENNPNATREQAIKYADKKIGATPTDLYQNLLKELETGRGKEVLDRIKKDYNKKLIKGTQKDLENLERWKNRLRENPDDETAKTWRNEVAKKIEYGDYTLEEQQEEAIVELLGLMTAEKLDNVKDGKLISLLKRLLKEMKAFMRSLLSQREVEIDKLPDNMTLGDLANLLAYSNSKLILPGYEVEYTTPDNNKFKTYQEASNHISKLAKDVKDVDLDSIKLYKDKEIVKNIEDIPENSFFIDSINNEGFTDYRFEKKFNTWYLLANSVSSIVGIKSDTKIPDDILLKMYNNRNAYLTIKTPIYDEETDDYYGEYEFKINENAAASDSFIEKNKEYEQSKEIIEEWKKVNNIQYNPEEIYSRGQEFSSVVGAYSSFDVNLMMQNLLSHIEDNEKAGGKFAISAYTKPIDKQIGHLEGGGGKIKFKLYPQSSDILWAANTDVFSGSVWDASEKINKDKKSELLGVSYTKYPSLSNVNTVQPNLAAIVDDLNHHHNELGIALTGNNFRLEYDEDIPHTTKKIIDGINKILDQKYGKLVKPEIKQKEFGTKYLTKEESAYGDFKTTIFNTEQEALDYKKSMEQYDDVVVRISKQLGIQPTQTNETLKESIDSVKDKNTSLKENEWAVEPVDENEFGVYTFMGKPIQLGFFSIKEASEWLNKNKPKNKEYTSQALINTKISALKEVAKKYPRSLIRSEVKPINRFDTKSYEQFDELEDLPFQKVPKKIDFNNLIGSKKNEVVSENNEIVNEVEDFSKENSKILFDNENKVTVDEVLDNIINNFDDLSPIGKELITKAKNLKNKTGANVKFVKESVLETENTVMQIDAKTNTIEISKERLAKVNNKIAVESFLHELGHAQSLQALINPVTFEEKQFAELINKMFKWYGNLSNGSESYGFTNEAEFVSELYTNKAFQDEIRALDVEENTSYWKQFINAVRRLFGLAKTKQSDLLIEQIITFVESDRTSYTGIGNRRVVFAKRIEDDSQYSSLESKLDNFNIAAKKAMITIQEKTVRSNRKKPTEAKEDRIRENKELLDTLDKYSKVQKWKAVIGYTQSFNNTINHVEKLLNELLSTKNIYEDKLDLTIKRYKDYLSAYDLLPQIKELMSQADLKLFELTDEEKEDYQQLKDFLVKAKEKHDAIESKFLAISKAQVMQDFSNPLYNTEVETKQREFLIREYNSLSDKGGLTADQYVSKMLTTRDKDDYQADLKSSAEKILNDPSQDISWFSAKAEDNLNTKSKLIQVVNQMLIESFDKVKSLTVDKVHKMAKTFEKFIKEKGNVKLSELNKNLIERDSEGNVYLKGDYKLSFKEAFDNELRPVLKARQEYIEESISLGLEEGDYLSSKKFKEFNYQISQWYKRHTTKDPDGKTIPKFKYSNKRLTGTEKEILDSYIKINDDNDNIEGFQSLVTDIIGARFHKLPSQSKSDLERALEKDLKGITKDKWNDLTKVRTDDIGLQTGNEDKNSQGEIINRVKTHYRGKIDPNEQSLDLETMFRNEYWNGQNYKEKSRLEPKLLMITDIAKEKEFYTGKNKDVVPGLSNTYNRLVGMMERNVYDIMSKHGGNWGQVDINKVTNALNGYAAGLAMTFNAAASTTNIIGGLTDIFIEAVGGHRFNVKTFRKAEGKYTKEILNGNILKDTYSSVKTSYFNQLLEMFDVFGGLGQNEQEALRNSFARKFVTTKSGNILNEMGEHAMHSILTQSILDGIKAMDINNNYLDKDGNITTEEKGASLADMLYFDSEGVLRMNNKVVYSKANLTVKYNDGGKSQINSLIKHSIFNLFGVYDTKYQSEFSKTVAGKWVMLFKKFFLSKAAYRFTGFGTSLKKKENLTEDDRFYNSAEKEYIEGTYTTFVRFVREVGIPNLQMLQTMYMNWKNLSEYEKSNLKKATMEIMLTAVILPLLGMMMAGMGDDDDDSNLLWFAIYINRRLTRELSQFRNPIEAAKMISNPVAGIRLIQNGLNFMYDVTTPINFVPGENESVFGYLDKNSKGENKMWDHASKLIHIVPQLGINYKQRHGLEFGK